MNRSYFHLSQRIFQNILYSNRTQTLNTNLQKRWAGHAKWQNVKADKAQSAKFKSMHFSRIIKDISKAVKESGDNTSTNAKLRNLIDTAKKLSMSGTTIQRAIDRGKTKSGGKPYWIACRGPFNVHVSFEVTFSQQAHFQTECGSKLKKAGLKMEKNVYELCNEKGIIVCEPLKDMENSLDKALEDGIEVGANDVFQMEDKTLIFECSADRVDSIENQLSKRGYKVDSFGTEVQFHETVKMADEEMQKLNIILNKIVESHDEIQRFSHNIVVQETT